MRRSVLLTLAALGALVSLIGGAGLFSALTDTARTGTNSAESDALAASADIQLATASVVPSATGENLIQCGTFSENLSSGLFTVSGVTPGYSSEPPFTYLCIRNVGSQNVALSFGADELVETDFACTGDEALHGDVSCGGGVGAGDLGFVLQAGLTRWAMCAEGAHQGETVGALSSLAESPSPLGTLGPGGKECFSASLRYPSTVSAGEQQRAQSDRVTWRFRFDAQAQP